MELTLIPINLVFPLWVSAYCLQSLFLQHIINPPTFHQSFHVPVDPSPLIIPPQHHQFPNIPSVLLCILWIPNYACALIQNSQCESRLTSITSKLIMPQHHIPIYLSWIRKNLGCFTKYQPFMVGSQWKMKPQVNMVCKLSHAHLQYRIHPKHTSYIYSQPPIPYDNTAAMSLLEIDICIMDLIIHI